MKQSISFFLLLQFSSLYCMDNTTQNHLMVTKKAFTISLNQLAKKADEGDVPSALALVDFWQLMDNPSSKIFESSKKILTERGFLDHSGAIHQPVREALNDSSKKQ